MSKFAKLSKTFSFPLPDRLWSLTMIDSLRSKKPSSQEREPRQQLRSRLFALPLELRSEIYLYVFASSNLHECTELPLSDWDNLMLTCRRAKIEMDSLPPWQIIFIVQNNWEDHFGLPFQALHVTYSPSKPGEESNLCIAVPYHLFGKGYEDLIQDYVPKFISPLFRLRVDTIKITLLNDGTLSPVWNLMTVNWQYSPHECIMQILKILTAREPMLTMLYRRRGRWSPSRNYFNCKRLIMDCGEVPAYVCSKREKTRYRLGLLLERVTSKPFRMTIGMHARRDITQWREDGNLYLWGAEFTSEKRFKR